MAVVFLGMKDAEAQNNHSGIIPGFNDEEDLEAKSRHINGDRKSYFNKNLDKIKDYNKKGAYTPQSKFSNVPPHELALGIFDASNNYLQGRYPFNKNDLYHFNMFLSVEFEKFLIKKYSLSIDAASIISTSALHMFSELDKDSKYWNFKDALQDSKDKLLLDVAGDLLEFLQSLN